MPDRLLPAMIARAYLSILCAARSTFAADFSWPDITNVFSFGDSYTDSLSRIVNGSLSPPNDAGVRLFEVDFAPNGC